MGIMSIFSKACAKCGFSETFNYHANAESHDRGDYVERFDIKARPGDIIEYKLLRSQHWALYTDRGFVIHASDESSVAEQLLIKVALGFRCRVNNLDKEALERGLKARPVADVLRDAHAHLDQKVDAADSQLLVTKWRFGHSFHTQVSIDRTFATKLIDTLFKDFKK